MKTKFIIATLMLVFTLSAQAVKIESFTAKCSGGTVTVDLRIEDCPVQVELNWAFIPKGKTMPTSVGVMPMEGSTICFIAPELPANDYSLRLIFNGVDTHFVPVSTTTTSCVAGIPSDD
jgi:hypothetical protein